MGKFGSISQRMTLSYILIILAVLALLNTYPLIVSENMVFRSKQTTMQSTVSVMVSALSGLDVLTEKNVAQALTVAEDTAVSRVLVTDADGLVLYDDRESGGAVGSYALYTEIVKALQRRLLCRLFRWGLPQPRGFAGGVPGADHRRGLCL